MSAMLSRVAFRFGPLAAMAVLLAVTPGCGSHKRLQFSLRGQVLGVGYNATIVGEQDLSQEGYRELSQQVQTRLAEILTKTSLGLPFSEISRLNEHRDPTPFRISTEILEVLRHAQAAARQTDGAFDVTIRPLKAVWGLDENPSGIRVPPPEEIDRAATRCGWRKLQISPSGSAVFKETADLVVDLSEVANGYAADELSRILAEAGWPDHVLQVGEEVLTHGADRMGKPWRISIQRAPARASSGSVIPISNHAIAVTGNEEWFRGADGQLYSRQIDPRTGRPVQHDLLSAAVISERGVDAGVYSRALLVMGEKDGLRFAEQNGLAALLLVQNANGGIEEAMTEGFERLTQSSAAPLASVPGPEQWAFRAAAPRR